MLERQLRVKEKLKKRREKLRASLNRKERPEVKVRSSKNSLDLDDEEEEDDDGFGVDGKLGRGDAWRRSRGSTSFDGGEMERRSSAGVQVTEL